MKSIKVLEWIWKRPIISVGLVLVIFVSLSVSGFWITKKGSVVDYPIRNENNKWMAAEKAVKDSSINFSSPAFIYMRCYPHITRNHLLALIQFQERIEKFFVDKGLGDKFFILSLANAANYWKTDDAGGSFITQQMLNDSSFDVRAWVEKTLLRIDVNGGLAGEVSGEYEYFFVSIFPEQDFPELEMYRLTRAFLKGKDLSIWELYLIPKQEIDPSLLKVIGKKVNMTVEPMSWSEGRGEIDVQTNAVLWINVFGGVIFLSAMILLIVLLPRQVAVSLTIIVLAFLSNRALIGVFDFVSTWFGGFPYRDDVFCVLCATAPLIAGFSFPLRSFYKFNIEMEKALALSDGGEISDEVYWATWRNAFQKVFPAVSLVVFIAILDYLLYMGLQQYRGSRSMWQVAIFSATGIFLSYFLTVVFLPPFYKLIGGKKTEPYLKRLAKVENKKGFSGWVVSVNRRAVDSLSRFFLRRAVEKKPIAPVTVFVFTVILTIVFLSQGRLVTDSRPEELLESVPMGDVIRELRKPGRPGFCIDQVYVKADLNDAATLDRVWDYFVEMRKAGRMGFGPMNYFVSILKRDVPQYKIGGSIKKAVDDYVVGYLGEEASPGEIQEESRIFVSDIWNDVYNKMPDLMKHFLARDAETGEFSQAIFVLTLTTGSAAQMSAYSELFYEKAEEYNLEVEVPDTTPQYAEVDRMINQGPFNTPAPWGTLLNDAMSQATIVLIVFLVFARRNRKNGSQTKISPLVGGLLVAIPFTFSSMVVLLLMMLYHIPFDVATASIRSITVSVAVDLPIFLLFGFQSAIAGKGNFTETMMGEDMLHEANEVFTDFLVNALAFVPLITVSFVIVHRIGLMLDVAMLMFYIATMWMVLPFLRYAIKTK